jgi:hypothetical protein
MYSYWTWQQQHHQFDNSGIPAGLGLLGLLVPAARAPAVPSHGWLVRCWTCGWLQHQLPPGSDRRVSGRVCTCLKQMIAAFLCMQCKWVHLSLAQFLISAMARGTVLLLVHLLNTNAGMSQHPSHVVKVTVL